MLKKREHAMLTRDTTTSPPRPCTLAAHVALQIDHASCHVRVRVSERRRVCALVRVTQLSPAAACRTQTSSFGGHQSPLLLRIAFRRREHRRAVTFAK